MVGHGQERWFRSDSSGCACRSARRWVVPHRTELLVRGQDVEVLGGGFYLFALLLASHAASSRLFVRASRSELR